MGGQILFLNLFVSVIIATSLQKKIVNGEGEKISFAADTSNCNLDQAIVDEIHSYQDAVNQIVNLFLTNSYKGKSYEMLLDMTDIFGPRMVGTEALENTIDWVLDKARFKKFSSVYTEPVIAPHWVRNNESLYMVSPRIQKLGILGLGTSIGTPPQGITAEILVVSSFDDLTANMDLAPGKIIVYNQPFMSYSDSVTYRIFGAQEASKVGGIACLVRSVTDFSIATPHTGIQFYNDTVDKIPVASITVEDAIMLERMQARGEAITLHLEMEEENLEDFNTRNTIIEITGSQYPEEVVVVSGHIDSWDVGTGSMDDGGGCTVAYIAAEAIQFLGFTPRRTFRTIMFTAEEQGVYGGAAYFAAHENESQNFQIIMESDYGTFYPRAIQFSGTDEATCMMQEIVSLTSLLGTDTLMTPHLDAPDVEDFGNVGVPLGTLLSDSERYFWFHHNEGDTMEVQDSDSMDRVAALWTSVSYVLSDVSFRLPQE